MLQSMGLQRIGHDVATEQQQLLTLDISLFLSFVKVPSEKQYLSLMTNNVEHYMFISYM